MVVRFSPAVHSQQLPVTRALRRYGIEWPPANYQPSVDKTWKPLVGFSFVYVIRPTFLLARSVCSDSFAQVRGPGRPHS